MANPNKQSATLNGVGQTALQTNVEDSRTFVLDVTGTFTGTMQFQTSLDGVTWRNITSATTILNLSTGTYLTGGNITAQGLFAVDVSSAPLIRVICTAYTSGTINIQSAVTTTGNLSPAFVAQSSTVTANQGTLAAGTAYSLVTAATTNIAVVKATAGNLFEFTVSNPTATPVHVKLYNKATAPVLTTDVPVMTLPVPANSFVSYVPGGQGKRFALGIGISVTSGMAANDTAVAVAGVQVHGTYI